MLGDEVFVGKLSILEKNIGYTFNNKDLLVCALTHKSYGNENRRFKNISYERLEFLGDSLLGFAAAAFLYKYTPCLKEGEMSKYKAALVCEDALSKTAVRLKIGDYLLMSKGTEMTGGRENHSILADTVEAICAAIYMDSDANNAIRFLEDNVLNNFAIPSIKNDSKSRLQEILAVVGKKPEYQLLKESGPDHNKSFECAVLVDDTILGVGMGCSKKEAQMKAAQEALDKYRRSGD